MKVKRGKRKKKNDSYSKSTTIQDGTKKVGSNSVVTRVTGTKVIKWKKISESLKIKLSTFPLKNSEPERH